MFHHHHHLLLLTQFLVLLLPLLLILPLAAEAEAEAGGTSAPKLPIVDLGYELYQASSFDSENGLYNFSNIRYAEPPVGDLRFRAPVPPRPRNRSKIIDQGKIGRVCPQGLPGWGAVVAEFLPGYLANKTLNGSAIDSVFASLSGSSLPPPQPPQDPRVSEDCLFLNIVVPQKVFEQQATAPHRKPLAPVLVWIHGGAYTLGEKTDSGQYNPTGIIKTSQSSSNSAGLVYVAINYRLGAFGWLSGPNLQADGTANAGLYDQQLALRWVQKYIKLFGGDAKRVTVIGESAGGGSIMHQLTAFGGLDHNPVPFQQAIIQSPYIVDPLSSFEQQKTFEDFLSLLKVKTIAEARKLPSSSLIAANSLQIQQSSPYGTFTYGPVLDGRFTPASVGRLLRQGWFDKNVRLIVAHNVNEALYFTSPAIRNESAFIDAIQQTYPAISATSTEYIANVLYPPVFDGSYGYTDHFTRAVQLFSDVKITCNTDYLNRAYEGKTYAYRFSVPPALHGQDIGYTFYNNGPNSSAELSSTASFVGGLFDQAIVEALQKYLVTFTATGVPSPRSENLPIFPKWGNDTNLLDLNVTGIDIAKDDTANSRCAWWQKALYY